VNVSALLRSHSVDPPVVIRTPLSIYDISQNLRARANDSRDWAIPEDLRKMGVDKLILEGVGEDLTLEWGGRTNPVNNPACFLTIRRLADGGSEVTVRFGRGTLRVFALLALLATPFEVLTDDLGTMRWLFVAAQAVVSLGFLTLGSSKRPLLKAHLMKIVEHATRSRGVPAGDAALPRPDTVPRLSP
jgi:hypothetical protein